MKLFLTLFTFLLWSSASIAKNEITDTTAVIEAAKTDAAKFRYTKAQKAVIKANLHNPSSDYFKPTSSYASQQSLLSDSLYVKTFKYYALKKTKARRTGKTLLLVGGITVVLLAAIIGLAEAAGPGLPSY